MKIINLNLSKTVIILKFLKLMLYLKMSKDIRDYVQYSMP